MTRPVCRWCKGMIPLEFRRDALFCSKRCRQAHHRFQEGLVVQERAGRPLRFGYGDPPYPEKAHLYRGHPDYAGEVDHRALVSRLEGFDGWALSTSAEALQEVLALCTELGVRVRIASWHRGVRPAVSGKVLNGWEPVIYCRPREFSPDGPTAARSDALSHIARPRLTDPQRVIGAKPAAFIWWLFELLGARPGDSFDDLYAGSGGVSRAWELFESATGPDPSSRARSDG